MFDQFYTTLESLGIVPVVVLDKVEDAAPSLTPLWQPA